MQIEPANRRIRAYFNGAFIVDTEDAKYVYETKRSLQIYVPLVDCKYLTSSENDSAEIKVSNKTSHKKATIFKSGELAGLVKIPFDAVDAWYQEDEEIYIHARNPYHRVEVVDSSKHVQVYTTDGTLVADSHTPRILYETGFVPRFYLPKVDCKGEFLQESSTHSACPYKGEASYYNVNVKDKEYKDLVWYYPSPLIESAKIVGLLCFWNEKCKIVVNGISR